MNLISIKDLPTSKPFVREVRKQPQSRRKRVKTVCLMKDLHPEHKEPL